MSDNTALPTPDDVQLEMVRQLRDTFRNFMLNYQFGIDEILTKINILRAEFQHTNEYSPIEHVTSRLKTVESIVGKMKRKGGPFTMAQIRETIRDIAGIRVVCSFIEDAYTIADALTQQQDITLLQTKDYIKEPKPNGYRSLHLIVEVPIFLSSTCVQVPVEVQIRTIAMDFWASLEHKIYYKFDNEIPAPLLDGLREAALTAGHLDVQMEQIHREVRELRPVNRPFLPLDDDREIEFPSAETIRNLFTKDDDQSGH